jgi:hypothetical protein
MLKYHCLLFVAYLLLVSSDCDVAQEQKLSSNFRLAQEYEISGPRCFPLLSKSIDANPYHPALLSQKYTNIRKGFGFPVVVDGSSMLCPFDSPDSCEIKKSISKTQTTSNSYSISLGNSKAFSKSIGRIYFYKLRPFLYVLISGLESEKNQTSHNVNSY